MMRRDNMELQKRENMRGGDGVIEILHLDKKENMTNCRLFSHITVPVGGSIGSHQHDNETEYFYLLEGEALANDNGEEVTLKKGDLLKTGNGASHSIRNTGNIPLSMIAVIITH